MNMKSILEMKARREDARLKAAAILGKAEAERRFLSAEEQKEFDALEAEIRSWDESVNRAEKLLAAEPRGEESLKSNAVVKQELESGQTAKITVENLVKMWSRLRSRSRANAVWYVNQQLEPLLYALQMGDKPVYIPAGGLSEKPYATLFGRPVVPIEQCSDLGEAGDILLADLSQYLLIDKGGVNAASSIHVRFLNDEQVFRFIYRVDGQPLWNKPITPYKGSATLSPFVALAKRN